MVHACVRSRSPFRASSSTEPRERALARRRALSHGPTGRAKARAAFTARVPSSNRPRTPCRARVRVRRTVPPSASRTCTGPVAPRERDAPATIGSLFRDAPRRTARSARAEVRSTAALLETIREDHSPLPHPSRARRHAAPESPRRGSDALQQRKPAPLGPRRDARRDAPSNRRRLDRRTIGGLLHPPVELRPQRT